ncbi:hypothetical protein INT47_001187 [Mucor saturninus]|uniref:Uncharacterized protein n=1 Tax=Mucor saturninus TaxID=64648 RepID=A0A8H7RNU1_9FUNG|nr:hypothetical protein INT47_001187 [Mucor saturninus]
MEGSNAWNSSYWIDELAKFTDNTELAEQAFGLGSNAKPNNGFKEPRKGWGDLVDVGESGVKNANQERDKEYVDRRQVSQSPENRSTNDHQKGRVEEGEKQKKKNYNTEQISCTLNDLIEGLNSPTIRAAVSKMEEEGKQHRKPSSPPIVTFQSIVEEQKSKAKTYNTNAKEFVPNFSKWN